MKVRAALALVAVLMFASAASAGPVLDAAQRSEALLAEGKHIEALDALDQALDTAWEASPLIFRKAMLVKDSSGFARYTERDDNRVHTDERVTVYSEPVGFTYRQAGELYVAELGVDMTIENATGQILVDVKDIFAVRTETRAKQRQFFLGMSHAVPYIRPGDYIATYTVRDKNSDKKGSFQIPLTVVSGEAPEPGTAQTPAGSSDAGPQPAEPAAVSSGQGG